MRDMRKRGAEIVKGWAETGWAEIGWVEIGWV